MSVHLLKVRIKKLIGLGPIFFVTLESFAVVQLIATLNNQNGIQACKGPLKKNGSSKKSPLQNLSGSNKLMLKLHQNPKLLHLK